MSARLLAIITPGEEAAALASLAGLVTLARAADADVRLAYVRDLPAPRIDRRHDRVVADIDHEMARIAAETTQTFDAAARVYDDVKIETVVRFGASRREIAVETEVYAPQVVVLFTAAGLLARLRGWALHRWLVRRPGSRVLLLTPPSRPASAAGPGPIAPATPPVHLPARRD